MEIDHHLHAQIRWVEKKIKEIKLKVKFWLMFIPTLILISILILQNNLGQEVFAFFSMAVAVMFSLILLLVIEKYTKLQIEHQNRRRELVGRYYKSKK